MSEPVVIARNDPFGSMPQFRSRIAANPDWYGLNALETRTVRSGGLASGPTTLLTVPSAKRARSAAGVLMLHNPTAGAITCDLHHVPSGGTAGTTNKMLPTQTLAANETKALFSLDLWHVLSSGDALVVNTGALGLNAWAQVLEERREIAAYIGGFAGNLGTTDTTLITIPALRAAAVKTLLAFNGTAGAITLAVNLRASGVAATNSNQVVSTSIAAGAGYTLDLGLLPTVSAGGVLSARGSVAGVNLWASAALY